MLDVLREEKKYFLSIQELTYVKAQLQNIMSGDTLNGYKPYIVRSLYFDSFYNTDYYEKKAGLNQRKKIRLRIYDPAQDNAKLEIKAKSGSMQRKHSITISKQDALSMINCDFDVLKKYDEEIAEYLYRKMTLELYRPKAVVEYDRTAFSANANDTRITFDMNIRANEGNFNIFDDKLILYPVIPYDKGVLEVKYNRFLLSYIKEALNCVDTLESSVSKYYFSRKLGLGGE